MGGADVRTDIFLSNLPRTESGLPRVGSVVIHKRLGKGGVGAVYLGFDDKLAAQVAVKVLRFEMAESRDAVERFFREARSTFKVDHPNVVRVLAVDVEAATHYIIMEFVDGESADDRLRREGALPERDALEIAIGAGDALAAAHAEGVLHRDVKPANIMIRFRDGRVKLTDLGLAKALGRRAEGLDGLTATGQMLGTPAYISPEQAKDAASADERADIYSLGATLYSLLTDKPPFEAAQLYDLLEMVIHEGPRDIRFLRQDLTQRTLDAVKRLMDKAASQRPQTMGEAVGLLRACLEEAPAEGARGLARPEMAGRQKTDAAEGPALDSSSRESPSPAGQAAGAAVEDRTPTPSTPVLDDRCPYAIVDAVIGTVVRLVPAIADDDAAWEAFIASRGSEHREYFEAIRRSRHSVFDYQQQQLFEFGIEQTRSDPPEEFCADCGRQFMRMFSLDNIRGFLRTALARRGALRETIVEMLRTYLHRYTGARFVLSDEVGPEGIYLTIESSDPESASAYFERHGLDPERCFRNIFYFVAGSVDKTLSHVFPGYDASAAVFSVSGQKGQMRFPVKGGDLFTRETFSQMIMGYIDRLFVHREEPAEVESPEADVIMRSAVMRKTWERIRRASRTDEIVLLYGESGTGKSFIARKIHELSRRSDKPFVEVGLTSDIGSDNMIQSDLFGHERGAFTGAAEEKQGLFSLANDGTIFLDEIGDASGELQAKLLRVIENSTFKRLGGVRDIKVDARVIAATNRDLEGMVKEGTFRQDLYYRLKVIPIELPPLRERPEDVPDLAEFLLARATRPEAPRKGLAPGLASELSSCPWPGNVRELDHALKHAVAMADGPEIARADLPESVRAFLEGRAAPEAASESERADSGEAARDEIINLEALRRMIRSSDLASVGKSDAAHVDHAKRAYLAALIDELGGELPLIAKFWDRTSEKTIRKLIKEYGLTEKLEAARARGRP